MRPLPIGISTLKTIIEEEMVYVDKTGIIEPLAKVPGRYFLSRPRRFGKSLLVDTFKQLFEGNEPLFRGLAIHDSWDWSKKYPVIKIDFAGGVLQNEEDFENKLIPVLDRIAGEYDIELSTRGLPNRLGELVQELFARTGSPVVILVDEYDKPLLDNIEDPEKAILLRDLLKEFYSPIKELDAYLQFVFLTGVSKFSKVSIFSGINNLKDISLDPNYATICGYTQNDLETDFAEHLDGVDWERLKGWYNGYNFLGEAVYNPFDILLFISEDRRYRNFCFESGTPSFLVKLLQKKRSFLPGLEGAIRRLFAGIPWRNFTNNDIVDYEGYWASVLYAFFVSLTCEIIPEDITNQGQADLTIKLENVICVIEIKVIEGEDTREDTAVETDGTNGALEQIKARGYAEKYLGLPVVRVFEAGMVFSQIKRNMTGFAWSEVSG